MAIEQRSRGIGQVADRIDVSHFAVGDEAGEQCPVLRADLVSGEEGVLTGKGNFSDLIFDRVSSNASPIL